jgi:hypothetical protein
MQRLVANDANVNAIDNNGRTPLHEAAQAGAGTAMQETLANGPNVNAVGYNGRTPLVRTQIPCHASGTLFALFTVFGLYCYSDEMQWNMKVVRIDARCFKASNLPPIALSPGV